MAELRDALAARRSQSKVTVDAPTHEQVLAAVALAARVADHSGLQPWRLIELRGDARLRLGQAMADAENGPGSTPSTKPLRASLLIAVVCSPRPSEKVPAWEQEAVASGVAHMLSLLLDDEGWGVMWRTGHTVRSAEVARMHGLAEHERLLGWLYVGGRIAPRHEKAGARSSVDAARFVNVLDR